MGIPQPAAVRAVEQGNADYVFGEVQDDPRPELDTLFTRYAGQVHTNAQSAVIYFFLNSRVAPFDDVNVRRALNYAVDRRAAASLEGGLRTAQPTCQIVPPNFPGYRPYCPYTGAPTPGRASGGPLLAKARRLIAGSHTRGMRVSVWAPDPQFAEAARFIVRLLNELGYRASLRLVPFQKYWRYVADSRHRAQIGAIWWGVDYPAASDFLSQFSCRGFKPGDPFNSNWSEFCDKRADQLMARAGRLQLADPRSANAIWAQAERRIVDQAAALPLVNPKQVDVLGRRVGNYQYNPLWGILLDQLWLR
jgi:peptide/nickel transport system substrate-binding protein